MLCEIMVRGMRRYLPLFVLGSAVLLSACAVPVVQEAPSPGVRIASASRLAVEAEVEGRRIKISAPDRHCVFPGSVGVSDNAAHMVIGDCVWFLPRAGNPAVQAVSGREGVLGITLLGEAFPKTAWPDFATFIGSADGAVLMEADAAADVIQDEIGVFVVTENGQQGRDVICRVYTEINGRLAVVALLNPQEGADVAAMRARLTAFVREMKTLNRGKRLFS